MAFREGSVRAYSASSLEAVRAHNLLKDWAGESFLTEAQCQRMEQETVCDLRRTNIFLRLALFLFTLIITGAAVALFFTVFLSGPPMQVAGIVLLVFAALSYAAAELAVSEKQLYRYGIEEALAVCAVGCLCAAMLALFDGGLFSSGPKAMEFLVPAAGAIASLWIWHRFGLPYAFLAAMIFVVWLPGYWTSSQDARHLLVAVFYAVALLILVAVRPPIASRISTMSIRSPKHSSGSASTWQSTSSFRR
jgi:hypothetical protein